MKPSLNTRISTSKYHRSKFSLPNQSICRIGLDAYFYFNLSYSQQYFHIIYYLT